jgi:hypothetical protein
MLRPLALLSPLLLLLLLAPPAALAFIPSPTQQPTAAAAATRAGVPATMSSTTVPSANGPVPEQTQAARASLFKPPLMSFYGEQRRR